MNLSKLFSGVLTVFAFSLAQGLVIESTLSGGPMMGEEPRHTKSLAVSKKFKTVVSKDESVIVRLDKELMIRLSSEKKNYKEITFAQLDALRQSLMGQMAPQMQQMKESLKSMPEAQRKMMEQMMGNMGGGSDAKVESKATGEKQTIAGFSAVKYTFSQDGKEVMSIWASKDVPGFGNLKKDYAEFGRKMGALSPGMSKNLNEAIHSVDGFPLQTIMANGMKIIVTKIEKKSLPDSEFEIPAGYAKSEENMMGGHGRPR